MEERTPKCQVCGMELSEGMYGTEKEEAALSLRYCRFCYANGEFTDPKAAAGRAEPMRVGIHGHRRRRSVGIHPSAGRAR